MCFSFITNSNSRTTRPSTKTTTTTTTTATPLKWAQAFIDAVAAVPCQQMKAAATNDKVKDISRFHEFETFIPVFENFDRPLIASVNSFLSYSAVLIKIGLLFSVT